MPLGQREERRKIRQQRFVGSPVHRRRGEADEE
jgi:hypothetical protein